MARAKQDFLELHRRTVLYVVVLQQPSHDFIMNQTTGVQCPGKWSIFSKKSGTFLNNFSLGLSSFIDLN
jgi:hypothetical protein